MEYATLLTKSKGLRVNGIITNMIHQKLQYVDSLSIYGLLVSPALLELLQEIVEFLKMSLCVGSFVLRNPAFKKDIDSVFWVMLMD